MQFVTIPEVTNGTCVYLGQMTLDSSNRGGFQSGGPYQVGVRVTTVNGLIKKLEDNGTEDGIADDTDHYAYWGSADYYPNIMDNDSGMPAKLRGKSLEELLDMQTVPDDDKHKKDAVSGATVWSNAVRYAAIDALRSEPISTSASTVLAPTLTEQTCVANIDGKYIDVAMSADDDTTIRYTLDGTDPTAGSTEADSIGWSGDIGVRLEPDLDKYPKGQVIEVRAAAFDNNGKRSDVVRQFYVFANPLSNAAYTSQPSGVSATVGDITATAVTSSPSLTGGYSYITSLSLDKKHSEQYADFLPELFSRIYLAQTTADVEPIEGHETESKAVLAAVQAALNQALTASKPVLTVSSEKFTYENDDIVTVTLNCPTEGAEIYYTVDNSRTLTGSTLSDPTKTGKPYTDSFNVSIGHIDGGTVYVRAAAKKDGKWSAITRKDLSFAKGSRDTFTVNGQNYLEWADAVNAVAANGTITINDDVALTENDTMPSVPCTIRSAEGTKYTLSVSSPLTLNADLTLDNIKYSAKQQPLYANGHNLTIGKDVEASYISGFDLYAGSTENSTAATQSITVQSGTFNVIASGSAGTTHSANVNIAAGGSATVTMIGADTNAKLNGNVQFTVETGARLDSFYGEKSGGTISDNLTLKLVGTPTLFVYGSTFKASENRDSFGTLDLREASTYFISANKDKFTGFASVLTTN